MFSFITSNEFLQFKQSKQRYKNIYNTIHYNRTSTSAYLRDFQDVFANRYTYTHILINLNNKLDLVLHNIIQSCPFGDYLEN